MKPDQIAVTIEGKIVLRVTQKGRVLLDENLTFDQMKAVIRELGGGLLFLLTTTRGMLNDMYPAEIQPNGLCSCSNCNLIRLRDQLNVPTMH